MKNFGFHFENSYTNLPEIMYTKQKPHTISHPKLIIFNEELAEKLGLDFTNASDQEKAEIFSGQKILDDSEPFAQAYAGHQFGHFTILGDGRALTLGEHIPPNGHKVDVQFKGSGRTPYSRQGDGKAALGPMLREYLISEALHALSIQTTRSLAVVATGEQVYREDILDGAMLTRIASSHIRVGTFEFAAVQKDITLLQKLLDYTIERHYPELIHSHDKAIELLNIMLDKHISLVMEWMRVGFIHGVMNTDNMTLSGETIDYGPCAFMNSFNPETVFSSIDHYKRYAYANQPVIAQWNLARFAEAILPLIDKDIEKATAKAEEALSSYSDTIKDKWLKMMRLKLGLQNTNPTDEELIDDLLSWMHERSIDYTNCFLALSVEDTIYCPDLEKAEIQPWLKRWNKRLETNSVSPDQAKELMCKQNPALIPRNHKVEEALMAATAGQLKPFITLHEALKSPYQNSIKLEPFQSPPGSSDKFYKTYCGT